MAADWRAIVSEGVLGGAAGSVLSALALALAGRRQGPSAAAPINAPSQWVWGVHDAQRADDADTRHTVTGYAVHHVAATWWAVLHATALGDLPGFDRPTRALAAAGVTAALAAWVDLKCTPERFTPGFQHRVSAPALLATYGAFAAGLGLASMLLRRQRALAGQRPSVERTPHVPAGPWPERARVRPGSTADRAPSR